MQEIWKDIDGYVGFYQVSNLGRIKRIEHTDKMGHTYKERIVKCSNQGNGYLRVHLSKNGISEWYRVHRLVATAFLPKKDGLDIVNHLDNNPLNNCVDNLELTDYKGNMQHATKQGRMHYNPENLKKAQMSRKRPVIASNGAEVLRFESATDAEKMGFNHRHISNCCNKRYGHKTHKGYEWRYENE